MRFTSNVLIGKLLLGNAPAASQASSVKAQNWFPLVAAR